MKSVTKDFGADHDRLDELFADFQRLKRQDPAAAKGKFEAFLKGLTRHIVWEEEVLFPLFEERSGMANGPTAVMRQEHRIIKECLNAIHEKVRAANPDSDVDEKALLEVLGAHNMKEERVLYPAIDNYLDSQGLEAVQKAMDSIPEERYVVTAAGSNRT